MIMEFGHFEQLYSEWAALQALINSKRSVVVVKGHNLSIAEAVAVAMHEKSACLTGDPAILNATKDSVHFLDAELERGRTVYGVTTGFGGSADTRTSKLESLQVALQQHLNVGILLPSDKGLLSSPAPQAEGLRSHALPVPLVRAMMVIRCNSLLRGHSGVRLTLIENIVAMLNLNMTPVVPLRGSVSASGDLSTLSYITDMLEGNPDVFVRVGNDHGSVYLPANEALKKAGIEPINCRAKEGLGITNGTASSCAAGCIAIYQAQQLAVLTQFLTAMGTEALLGTAHNYHSSISNARPHPGQVEVAANISTMLRGSKLALDTNPDTAGLAQDRYALRTAPQWIGPQLEDLALARHQVLVELNATTDNPLIDAPNKAIHHGGNFQAACITSAMEKTTTALQMLGKLLFAQSSELLNEKFNKGLPPNLAADDPSLSFTGKGLDVNMAAYMSELAYIAHPVSSHVQSAELHNQSVNSLALITARYALEAVELVSLMSATYVYLLCQALDLRCLHLEFVRAAEPAMFKLLHEHFRDLVPLGRFKVFAKQTWEVLQEKWLSLSHLDLGDRAATTTKESLSYLVASFIHNRNTAEDASQFLCIIEQYRKASSELLSSIYNSTRNEFFKRQSTAGYLSCTSAKLYSFVRKDLKIPFHRGLVDHPTLRRVNDGETVPGKILGTLASEIYLSIRNGKLYSVVMEALDQSHRAHRVQKL